MESTEAGKAPGSPQPRVQRPRPHRIVGQERQVLVQHLLPNVVPRRKGSEYLRRKKRRASRDSEGRRLPGGFRGRTSLEESGCVWDAPDAVVTSLMRSIVRTTSLLICIGKSGN